MLIASWAVMALVIVLVSCQTIAVAAFAWRLLNQAPVNQTGQTGLRSSPEPKAAVLLSLRGPDPFLRRSLDALKELDYSNYEVHLVIDSDTDPVWEDVRPYIESDDRFMAHVLREPRSTCSLKCSSLVQAVGDLDQDVEVVAFIDGDAVPHSSWLRDLVAPLDAPGIGVVTGNRWFIPQKTHWGTLVRYFWNVGAVVQVWLNGIVWAGSMAMRREVIDRIGLLDAWSRSLSVDATVCRQLRSHGLRVKFAPNVMMANREEIALDKFVRWVQRQLVAAKSCGPNWRIVALHAFSLTGSQAAAGALMLTALATQQWSAAWVSLGAIGLYWVSAASATLTTEFAVRRVLANNRDPARWPSLVWLAFMPALMLTHIVYPAALWGAYSKRKVSWRGVDYVIHGVNDVRMCDYEPFRRDGDTSQSIV